MARAASLLLLAAACAPSPEPRRLSAPVVHAADAGASEDAGTESALIEGGPLLPSGDYEVTTEVAKDTCTTADGGSLAPPTATMFVAMKVWRDKQGAEKVTGNFPLPLPRKGGFGSARSDITLSRGPPPKPVTLRGLGSKCPDYETKTLYAVLEQNTERVRISYARAYGDGSTCKAKVPSSCALDYVYTFRLVKAVCEPHCGVSFVRTTSGAEPRCHCPDDAGAP